MRIQIASVDVSPYRSAAWGSNTASDPNASDEKPIYAVRKLPFERRAESQPSQRGRSKPSLRNRSRTLGGARPDLM